MSPEEKKLEKLKEILDIANRDVPDAQEVAQLILSIIQAVKEAKDFLEKQARENKDELQNSFNKAISILNLEDIEERLKEMHKKMSEKVDKKMSDEMNTLTQNLYLELKKLKDLIPEVNFSEIYVKIKEVESKIVPFILKGEDIVDKINELPIEPEYQIGREHIKGLEEELKKIQIRPVNIGGRALLQLYVDGAKKGAVQFLNLIAGSNITLTYSSAYGRNDVTISGVAGGSMDVIAVTGTINDTNKVFASATEPTLVVINGLAYNGTTGSITWTWVATVLTLSQPVGSGGDIYAIG